MATLKVNAISYDLLSDGQLANIHEWNESLAEALAQREDIVLTEAHWKVIRLMRQYYEEFHTSPIRKLLKKSIAEQHGAEMAKDAYLDRLFPHGIQTQGTRIAGIPAPLLDAEQEQMSYKMRQAPDPAETRYFVDEFEFAGKKIKVFATGNLVNLDDWNESLAAFMATKEGLLLTSDHWEVIRFLRKFYFEYGISPMVRLLIKHLGEHGAKNKSSREYLYKLFPGGPAKQGSRLAGLPQPQGCIE